MKKLLAAALMVVAVSPAAFAAIQNVKVSGDITTSYVSLSSFDLGLTNGVANTLNGNNAITAPGFAPYGLKKENDFITQTRLRVDADLSDNVSTEVGLINERAWNGEGAASSSPTGYDTNVQLYLATITLRELLYSPLTVEIGRQTFNYGNGFIMGGAGAANLGSGNLTYIDQDLTERTAYDGVTATLDYKPLTISMIYFKNGQTNNSVDGMGHLDGGQNSDVYGYNLNYQLSDPWSTVVEQYGFARIDGSATLASSDQYAGNSKGNTLYVPGLRASTNPTKSLNLQGEVAWELGNVEVLDPAGTAQESEHRNAFAGQALATYTLPILDKYKPSVNAAYTYVSGDKNAAENYDGDHITSAKTYTAWDQFNTVQGAGTIYRSIFPMSDESIVSGGASFAPLEDVTASATWSGLWEPSRSSSAQNPLYIYQPDTAGTLQAVNVKNNKYYLGNETDVSLTYNYTEDVTFGLSLGWFVPGDVFKSSTHETADQAIASLGVKF